MKPWLLLTEFFPPEFGGIQRALQTLLKDAGSELTVLTRPQKSSQLFDEQQPYTVVRQSLFSGRMRPRWAWLIGWLWQRRKKFSMTVFGHFSMATTAAWFLAPFGFRYAILVHGQDVLSEANKFGRRPLIASILRRASWIGVNSQFVADQLHAFGVPLVRLVRTHPAIPASLLKETSARSAPRIVTIARLVERKNVDTILRALPLVARTIPSIHYDVVGDGPERTKLEQLAHELGVEDKVTFHGAIDDRIKRQILDQAQALVLVPRILAGGSDVEGLGIVYLEAAALGLPLIGSKTGGVPDIVQDGKNGRLVHPDQPQEIADAIQEVISNRTQAKKMGMAGKTIVEAEFTDQIRNARFNKLRGDWKESPRVSIIIPTYNHADTLGATLESVFDQTWKATEVIVVNDGSTDSTAAIMDQWRNRIQYIEQVNQGAPAARNAGAQSATGEYLLFLDADTNLRADMVDRMVTALETQPESTFAYSRFRFGPKGFRLHEFDVEKLRRQNYIHTSSLIRASDFPGFDPTLTRFQDWDLWLTLASAGKKGIFIPEELFAISQGKGGMKASTWIPRFVYKLPGIGQGKGNKNIQRYREAERVIRAKHGLSAD